MQTQTAFAARSMPAQAPASTGWAWALVEAFTLRMADHGHCVSPSMMQFDRRYAVQQLAQAHTLADASLRTLAMELFRQFEEQQSGVARLA